MAGTLLLVGCGKMGGALLSGWLDRKAADSYHVIEPGPGADAFKGKPGVTLHQGFESLPPGLAPEVVVLAVKPQTMAAALPAYRAFADKGAAFLSIAAGKTLGYFARHLGEKAAVVRSMPNTPAAIGRGIAVLCASPAVSPAQKDRCGALLAAAGEVGWVEDEGLIDAVTGVSGSGPAYVFLMIECLAKAGIEAGLAPDLAMRLARATVAGSGELARLSSDPASTLRENVTSPGGTTRAALDVLMAADGLEPLMVRAFAAATRRSRELAE